MGFIVPFYRIGEDFLSSELDVVCFFLGATFRKMNFCIGRGLLFLWLEALCKPANIVWKDCLIQNEKRDTAPLEILVS